MPLASYLLDQPTKRAGVVACDTFTRANSTTLGSTNGLPWLPGRPGLAWSEVAGNWEINTNRIGSEGASPGGQGWILTLDIGFSDYVLDWQLAYTPDANTSGVILGYVDGTNYLRFTHTSAAIGGLRVTAGTPSAIGTVGTAVVAAAGDIMRLTKIGAAYTYAVIRAGALVGLHTTASETQGQSSTVIGIRAATAAVRFTNFVARRAA